MDGRHPGERLVRADTSLLGQLGQALAHCREAALDGTRVGIVQRDATARRGDDLRDPAAHLARADDEDVFEPHGAGA